MFQNLNESILDENFSPLKPVKPAPKRNERKGIKRKFPGPAGLLSKNTLERGQNAEFLHSQCSQSTVSMFASAHWLKVTAHYGNLLEKYTVQWIKKSAKSKQLPCEKAPFLAAFIQNLSLFECKESITNVLLKDPTGEITATLANDVYKKYAHHLEIGAVVVLKKMGVLPSRTDPHLTITLRNLVAIYTPNETVTQLQSYSNLLEELTPPELQESTSHQEQRALEPTIRVAMTKTNASHVRTDASESKTTASDARTTASDDRTNASETRTTANDARTNASETRTNASEAKTTVDSKTKASWFDDDLDWSELDVSFTSPQCTSTQIKCAETNEADLWKEALDGIDPEFLLGDF